MNTSAEMIFTGDELLRGDTANTNQVFLGKECLEVGLMVTRAITITDDQAAIRDALVSAVGREPGLVVVSGGLGPTQDDLTREAVAEAVGRRLEEREELLSAITKRFESMGVHMAPNNRGQALVPEGSTAINFIGTAPGFWLEHGKTLIVVLPGVPTELRHMWEETVRPLVEARSALSTGAEDKRVAVSRLRVSGMGESTLAEALEGVASLRSGDIEAGTQASVGGITLILRTRGGASARSALQRAEGEVRQVLGDKIFGSGDRTLAEALGIRLKARGLTLSTAESCTGGLIAGLLTDTPGSSEYFRGGVTAYANGLKIQLLDVDPGLLETHGAVSEEVARAMAEGARRRLGSDCALSTTGIAGPGGGSDEKPVGLVYVCAAWGEETSVRRYKMLGGRRQIRERAAYAALDLMRRRLGEKGHLISGQMDG